MALIVGTFGRAIWILDDLLSLRQIAANRLNDIITALPVNAAVQVKGLFINPPGNIWSGFHTTFEGKNKVFQKTKIPYYLTQLKDSTAIVTGAIYNEKNEWINTIEGDSLVQGLNYLTWHLDEKSASLPRASQKIAVLPETYKVVIDYEGAVDSTTVSVISDPRFELHAEVDENLYTFRKQLDEQVRAISKGFSEIDKRKDILKKLKVELKDSLSNSDSSLSGYLRKMEYQLDDLRAKGQTPRPKRQVGAWQSFETTPFSMLQNLLMVADARTSLLSLQHQESLEELKKAIDNFNDKVDTFISQNWRKFSEEIKQSDLKWSDTWD